MNRVKTVLLMGLLTGLLMALGQAMGGRAGLQMALVFSIGMNFFGYWFSDKLVLLMYRAKEATQSDSPRRRALAGH